MWLPVFSMTRARTSLSKSKYLGALQNAIVVVLGVGGGQSLLNETSLLTWTMSAVVSQLLIFSLGYSTPFCSIIQAVSRVSAVTPVIAKMVMRDSSRFVSGLPLSDCTHSTPRRGGGSVTRTLSQ